MPLPIEAKDLAVGDWSPVYGTIIEIVPHHYQDELTHYTIEFFGGKKIDAEPNLQIEVVQGGGDLIHNGPPDPSQIREGLAADHAGE